MSETIRKFGSDFEQIDAVKSADKILIEDASDGVVKYAKPGQVSKALGDIAGDLEDAEDTLAALKKELEAAEESVNTAKTAAETANTAVNNISAKVERTDTGATVTVTDKDGTETTAELTNGADGTDGVSPTVNVEETDTGYRVTIIDTDGEHVFEIPNGTDGKDGTDADNVDLDALYSNVFIVYNSSATAHLAKLSEWADLQNGGTVALGVCVVEGGKHLVISKVNIGTLKWGSSTSVAQTPSPTDNRKEALEDMDGKANTESAMDTAGNEITYAIFYCNSYYSVKGIDSYGYPAGNWWLPSLGELLMIYANKTKINYALGLINNANKLLDDVYWSSTENAADKCNGAWAMDLENAKVISNKSKSSTCYVRPVTAFYEVSAM